MKINVIPKAEAARISGKEVTKQAKNAVTFNAVIDDIYQDIATGLPQAGITKYHVELILKMLSVYILENMRRGVAVEIKNLGLIGLLCINGIVRKSKYGDKVTDVPPHYLPALLAEPSLVKNFNAEVRFGSLNVGNEAEIMNKYVKRRKRFADGCDSGKDNTHD